MPIAYQTNFSSSDVVTIIDTANDKILYPSTGISVGPFPIGVAFTPDGAIAVVTNNDTDTSGDHPISFTNTTTSTVVSTLYPGGMPNAVAIATVGGNYYAYVSVETDNEERCIRRAEARD
jgi:DNA-binding beta-propeller fold protein YncE